jgi:branched-chain amino acid transport system ATP-binding protein
VAVLLELDDVQKSFGSVVVADGVSFMLAEGEALGIVGPNGAGKTSMLDLITGNIAPDGGRILFEGRDITRVAAHTRARSGIGRTHQIPRPFGGMTVFENILLGATYAGAGRHDGGDPVAVSARAAERSGLWSRVNVVAGSLALLDRKRLELARALATRPTLLLLDEIAGGLTEPEIEDLVRTITALRAEGIAIVWIEHVVQALISAVDRLIAMDYGRVVADGAPASVMADPRVRAVYLGQEMEL